ncbi:PspC domain-containing protein [Actinophytocola gossypii]|uniref:PspC domain-containing protein n=1 Tax=Actinophytocola gossypii TaxID=2812003 RepID=A0ABT2JJU1_9PSEU|nr:PspC domain-containing protein [Actinophytocola gossypii]MCT2588140.1 PspC domain-containing protein [Actinophytocola gossypii]
MSGNRTKSHLGAMHGDVEDMAKDFWATRPRRPRRGRKIAGVAAGVANRYRIDPTLVRVALVVAAIYGGAGIVAYLLGWLFLPEQDDEVSPFESMIGRGRSSTSTGFTLLLCLAFFPTFSWFFNGFAPGYLSLLVVAGLLYLLHRKRGHLDAEQPAPVADMPVPEMPTMPVPPTPPTPPAPPTPPTPPTAQPAARAEARADAPVEPEAERAPEPEPTPEERMTPPAWDPLGAAPFAWDLPDPTPPLEPEDEPEPPVPARKSRIGLLTVGIALIAAAGMGMANLDPTIIVGVALAVLGLGMVFGSFLRSGRGLIGLAVPLSVIGIGMTTVASDGWNGVGELNLRPTTESQVPSEFSRSVGSVHLDLTDLPATAEVDTNLHLGAGDVTVLLPETADVDLVCQADIGTIDCLGQTWDGVNGGEPHAIENDGPDGRGGLKVDLEIEVGTGDLEVRRVP